MHDVKEFSNKRSKYVFYLIWIFLERRAFYYKKFDNIQFQFYLNSCYVLQWTHAALDKILSTMIIVPLAWNMVRICSFIMEMVAPYCPQITSWSLRVVNVLSEVRGNTNHAGRGDFLLVSDKDA
jgi:hypothetical protein